MHSPDGKSNSHSVGYVVCRGVGVPTVSENFEADEARLVREQVEQLLSRKLSKEDICVINWNSQSFMPERDLKQWEHHNSEELPAFGPRYLHTLGEAWYRGIFIGWPTDVGSSATAPANI